MLSGTPPKRFSLSPPGGSHYHSMVLSSGHQRPLQLTELHPGLLETRAERGGEFVWGRYDGEGMAPLWVGPSIGVSPMRLHGLWATGGIRYHPTHRCVTRRMHNIFGERELVQLTLI